MAADRPNPLNLTAATSLPPNRVQNAPRSKSPARSPARKARFAAQELDPLLKNLSPDSTLEALQKTDTIGANLADQDALAQSISDASEEERKLGIRAAIAAKKLKEWMREVSAWYWPSVSDRAWGAGFIPKQNVGGENITYLGSLPDFLVQNYEDRLDEIWDAMETLDMDKIKNYVFSSHHPPLSAPTTGETARSTSSGYGRMRDFTALITATVVQALPVLANLYVLLETWSIRLNILRQVPDLLISLQQVRQGLVTINDIMCDEQKSRKVTQQEFEQGKVMFGNRVSNLGKRVDKMLDMLEGQDDSLPQAWIDSLEDIEGKYAEWVAKAEQVMLWNQMHREKPTFTESPTVVTPHDKAVSSPVSLAGAHLATPTKPGAGITTTEPDTPNSISDPTTKKSIKRKPVHDVNPRAEQRHRRGISEVSAAESNLSIYSLENAEIIDAQKTTMVPSRSVSLIEHPSWHNNNMVPQMDQNRLQPSQVQPDSPRRGRQSVKGVMLYRSASHDGFSPRCYYHRASSLPNVAMIARSRSHHHTRDRLANHGKQNHLLEPLTVSPSPSLRVDPLSIRGKEPAVQELDSRPSVPRKSSKRSSNPFTSSSDDLLASPESLGRSTAPFQNLSQSELAYSSELDSAKTFDDRLKRILATMPTKIKLAEASDSESASGSASDSSTRVSSSGRALKLSPVKDSKSGRNVTTSGIHVYHLSGAGKSRDAPPIKLFVRAVGEHGERIMVRVGGGWADLAEYLREYSLHHGGRGLVERKLEVANYPGQSQRRVRNAPTFDPVISVKEIRDSDLSEGSSAIDQTFDFGLADNHKKGMLDHDEIIPGGAISEPGQVVVADTGLPASYTSEPHARSLNPPITASPQPISEVTPPRPRPFTSTSSSPLITTSPTPYANRYTPLGAAGPAQSMRRTISHSQSPSNQAWVEGMVNQARAVSGSHVHPSSSPRTSTIITPPTTTISGTTQIVSQPTIVTTTTFTSPRRRPTNQRPGSTPRTVSSLSGYQASPSTNTTPTASTPGTVRPSAVTSPFGSQSSNATTSSRSTTGYMTANANTNANTNRHDAGQPNNSANLNNVGGVRRVFLRNRSNRRMY